MPHKISDDFQVSDKVREWSLKKYGFETLPDQFITEFRDHHIAAGTKKDNWGKAFQNWINWSSPAGRFYNAKKWEDALAACKRIQNKQKAVVPLPEIKKPPKPVNREKARDEIKKMRMRLG